MARQSKTQPKVPAPEPVPPAEAPPTGGDFSIYQAPSQVMTLPPELGAPTPDLVRIAAKPEHLRTTMERQLLARRLQQEHFTTSRGAKVINPIAGVALASTQGTQDTRAALAYDQASQSTMAANKPAETPTTDPVGGNPFAPAKIGVNADVRINKPAQDLKIDSPALTGPTAQPVPPITGGSQPAPGRVGYASRTMADGSVRTADELGGRKTFDNQDAALGYYRPEELARKQAEAARTAAAQPPAPAAPSPAPAPAAPPAPPAPVAAQPAPAPVAPPVAVAPPPVAPQPVPVAAATPVAPAAAPVPTAPTPKVSVADVADPVSAAPYDAPKPAAPAPAAPGAPIQPEAAAKTTAPTTKIAMTNSGMEKPGAAAPAPWLERATNPSTAGVALADVFRAGAKPVASAARSAASAVTAAAAPPAEVAAQMAANPSAVFSNPFRQNRPGSVAPNLNPRKPFQVNSVAAAGGYTPFGRIVPGPNGMIPAY